MQCAALAIACAKRSTAVLTYSTSRQPAGLRNSVVWYVDNNISEGYTILKMETG
jgi:hypothetical protein